MRWAIGFLLVINVTIFLWGNLTQNSTTMERRSGTASVVPGIGIPSPSPDLHTANTVATLPSATEYSGSDSEHDAILPPRVPEAEPEVESALAPVSVDRDSGVEADAPARSGDAAAVPGVPVSSAKTRTTQPEPVASDSSGSAPELSNRLYCGQIGPVPKASEAESVRMRLAEAGLQPVLQEIVKSRNKGFWVLIPPLSDREEGKRKLAELQKKGIKDTWLFRRGELNNAISLGLYNRRNNAEQRRQQLQALGFDVEVWPRVEPVSHFQVSFSGTGPAVLDRVRKLIPRFESRDGACLAGVPVVAKEL